MHRVLSEALFLSVLVCTARPSAQDPANPVFTSQADLVQLHVNVFDGNSDAVPELTRDNFLVFEDGRHQEITFFSSEDVPVAAGLVMDNSSSMIAKGRLVVSGAMAFADSSHPEDELFTVHFNEHVRFGLPGALAFTSSRPLLRGAVSSVRPGGTTALHDAVITALEHVETAGHQKHVIIVLSDGDDNASTHGRDEMYARARRSDAIIYTVAVNDPRTGGDGDPGVLRRLAGIGGGMAYLPKSDQATVAAFTEIAENIRRGYSIGYVPTNTARDGGWRTVKVMVRAPGKRLSARCRDGYTAPGSPGTW
ncbi:MAG: VWA domain-containing protein [Vicinamibacterales bacterium]